MSLRPYKKYECLGLVNFWIFYYQTSGHEIIEINFAMCLESDTLHRVSWILAYGEVEPSPCVLDLDTRRTTEYDLIPLTRSAPARRAFPLSLWSFSLSHAPSHLSPCCPDTARLMASAAARGPRTSRGPDAAATGTCGRRLERRRAAAGGPRAS